MPNIAPTFVNQPESLTLQINKTNSTGEAIYTLPQIIDHNVGDTQTVYVNGLQSFMTYDEAKGQIVIDKSVSVTGSYTISVKIVDQSNAVTIS